jgi:hypothetical protein
MANLVELSNQLEDFPEQQLVQMSQDPNSMYPSYLVLSEIQRRNQMRKMYEAQQPKPQTTVAEEVIGEFTGQQGLQGAMAQSPGPQDAFPPSDMGNMAPPSPMQAMASGGRTGYNLGGLLGPQNPGTFEEFKEKMIGEYIAATGKSRKEAEIFANENAKQRYSETIRNSQAQQDNTRRDSLLFTPNIQDALLNDTPLPESLQSRIDEAQEPSGLGKFAEAGTQFFFGDARPDAKYPNLARATDEFTDYLNIIPGAAGLKLGLGGTKALIKSGKALKQADNILPNTVPKTGGTPPAVVPRPGGTPPTSGIPVGPPKPPGTNLVPSGGPLVPSGGPLAVVPKVADDVADKSKGLISKAVDWIKNNPKKTAGFGLLGGATAYYSGEPNKKDNGAGGTGSTAPTTKEIKRSMDPLDLAKLGGIIMGAKNTSELGQGITALAGDIQERRYKEGVLKSKEEAMIIDRVNSLTKMLDDMNEGTPEYIRTFNARQSLIDSYYGPIAQGTDPMSILNANTVGSTDTKDTKDTSSGGLGGALKQSFMAMNPLLSLGGMGLKAGYEYLTKDDEVNNTIIPQQDLYNAFIKDAPNPQYLTGDPYIDNIMRIESGGMDRTNSTTGATGPMQVKIATLADPGYGIEPAKNDSVEEKIRVGADYFNAMKEEFNGDILNATIAYNLGPGATKKWLQAGGTIDELVKIQSSDGRPVGQAALEYIQKAYGPDIINRLS